MEVMNAGWESDIPDKGREGVDESVELRSGMIGNLDTSDVGDEGSGRIIRGRRYS
jgi:hypothetical protein